MAQDMGDRIHTEVKDIILALVFLTRPLQPPQISWFPLRSRFPVWVFTDRRFTLQGANTFRGFLYILQGSETILLVEDEESLRTLTRILLTQTGYTVLEANSGAQALDIAQRHEGPRLYGTRHPQSWSSGSRHSPPAKALTREILTRKVREALGADKLQKAGLPVELILGADKDKT